MVGTVVVVVVVVVMMVAAMVVTSRKKTICETKLYVTKSNSSHKSNSRNEQRNPSRMFIGQNVMGQNLCVTYVFTAQ